MISGNSEDLICRPSPKSDYEYERLEVDIWLKGRINDIQFRVNDKRSFTDKKTNEKKLRSVDEVRFVFEFEGYDYKHYSRWMTKSVYKESQLFKKYLKNLIPDIEPDMTVDLNSLIGKKIKSMWENEKGQDGNTYQTLITIKLDE